MRSGLAATRSGRFIATRWTRQPNLSTTPRRASTRLARLSGISPTSITRAFFTTPEKELAEARITFALVTNSEFPTPEGTEIPPAAFVKGMAESIGELRRHLLDLMRRGELARCEELLASMDDMYYLLTTMDYPDGITYGLRRLTDIARSIIERTRRRLHDIVDPEDVAGRAERSTPESCATLSVRVTTVGCGGSGQ